MVEYLVELFAFAIVLWVLYKYVWSGGLNLRGAMAARQEAIAAEIEEGRATRERLIAAEATYRDSIAGARAQSEQIRAESSAEGDVIVSELKARAEDEYRRMTILNETRLTAERQSVVAAMRQEVGRQTLELAEQMVMSALRDDERQRRVVDRFIADLDGSDQASNGPGASAPQPAGRAR